MNKYFYIFLLFLFLANTCLFAQFSVAQKDTVLNQIEFLSGDYSLTFNFRPEDYKKEKEKISPYKNLSEQEILAKKTNNYKDARIYQYLCLDFHLEKKDKKNAGKYYDLAIENYTLWVEKEPQSTVPYTEVFTLFYGTQSYKYFSHFLEEAALKFPKNTEILSWNVSIHLVLFADFAKTQKYINELLAIEPYNLTACMSQVMLYEFEYMAAAGQNKTLPNVDISLAQKALKANPKDAAYEHLYHFATVSKAYFASMVAFFKENDKKPNRNKEEDYKRFFSALTKEQKKDFVAAEKFLTKQLNSAPNNQPSKQLNNENKLRATLLNSLGFVSMYLGETEKAKKYFQLQYDEKNTLVTLECLILVSFLEKDWQKMEDLLELSISKFDDFKAYLSLMSIFDKYNKNETKKLSTIQRVEQKSAGDATRSILLAKWYLKQKNLERATFYCDLVRENDTEWIWLHLALSVLQDDKEKSKNYLDKILINTPENEKALKVKKTLKF